MADYNPEQIDVALSIGNPETVQALADSLKQTATLLDSIKNSDFGTVISKLETVADKFDKLFSGGGYTGGASSGASVAGSGSPAGTAPTTSQATQAVADAGRLADPGSAPTPPPTPASSSSWLERLAKAPQIAAKTMADPVGATLAGAGTAFNWWKNRGSASGGASTPDGPPGGPPDGPGPGGLGTPGNDVGGRPGSWGDAEHIIANQYLIQRASALWGKFASSGWSPTNAWKAGAELGYDREQDGHLPGGLHLPDHISGPFGMRFNFPGSQYQTAAGRQGLLQQADIQYMDKFSPYAALINKGEAESIEAATHSAGFGGAEGVAISNNLMAPTYAKYGVDPEIQKQFLGSLRTGTASIDQIKDSFSQMSSAARLANMDINQFAEQLTQVAEAVQTQGGTFQHGVERGLAFSTATGLPPEVAAKIQSSPVFQSMALSRTGLPPQLQGLLGPAAFGQSMNDAIKFEMGVYNGVFRPINSQITGAGGKVIGNEHISARQQQMAAAAQDLGVSPDEIHKILTDKNYVTSFNSSAALDKFRAQARRHVEFHHGAHGGDISWDELRDTMHHTKNGLSYKQLDADYAKYGGNYAKLADEIQSQMKKNAAEKKDHKYEIVLSGKAAQMFKLIDNLKHPEQGVTSAQALRGGALGNGLTTGPGNKPLPRIPQATHGHGF